MLVGEVENLGFLRGLSHQLGIGVMLIWMNSLHEMVVRSPYVPQCGSGFQAKRQKTFFQIHLLASVKNSLSRATKAESSKFNPPLPSPIVFKRLEIRRSRPIVSAMVQFRRPPIFIFFLLCASAAINAKAQDTSDRVHIAPLGKTVELKLETKAEQDYVLETQAKLMEGKEWEPLMRFRGSSAAPRNWVDPLCGSTDYRFFRLKKLLDAPPAEVSNFRLLDTTGTAHELYYDPRPAGAVLVFTGTNYSNVLPVLSELNTIRQSAGASNVLTWVITACDVDQRDALANFATNLPPDVPILQDLTHAVTRTLSTGMTPEVVLVSVADWSIAYRGPVSESVDTGKGIRASHLLADAVSELIAQRPVSVSSFATRLGTPAGLRPVAQADYTTKIAPLLLKSCMPCHSPGDIAPWSMTNHAVVQMYSKLIKSDVLSGLMPPWHADPKYSAFSNSKALTANEVSTLVDWIDRGSPRGTGEDVLATTQHQAPADWPLGTPDAIVSIPSQSIPATGTIDYKYLYASSPFSSDVWLRAVAVKPGNRTVVHHSLIFKGSISELIALQGGLSGFFAGYVPGMDQVAYPAGTGKQLKKSDTIVFQMHYTASGKATTDRTQLGLYLAPAKPNNELVTSSAYDTSFSIPPNSPNVYVSATRVFTHKSVLQEFSPHMHFRGATAKFTLRYPDGTSEVILNVPTYLFNWQALYRLQSPKEVPAGTTLLTEGSFDNSALNRFNPDPTSTVTFGEQSWQEMFIGYVNFIEIP